MATLYDLTGEWQELLTMAEDDDVDPQIIQDTFESVAGEFADKADAYAKVYESLKADAAQCDMEIKRLQQRRQMLSRNADHVKEALEQAMITTNQRKIKTALFSFGIRRTPARVVVDSEDFQTSKIPAEFWESGEPKLDKKSLKDALRGGGEVSGAHLESKKSLVIR